MAYNTGTDPTLAELITAKFIPAKFSKDVLFHTMSNLVIAGAVRTKFKDDMRQGYTISFPLLAEGTDAEVTPGTAPTPSDLLGTAPTITVDQWRVAAAEISDMADIEDAAGYLEEAAKSCGYRIRKRVDTKLGSLFSTLSGDSVYGSDGQTFTDDIWRALIETLDEADVPSEPRFLIGDPSLWADALNIDKFITTNYGGGQEILKGELGVKYNCKVLITNNLTAATTGNYGVLMHQDALGLIIQKAPRSQIVPIKQEFRTLLMVDIIYGVGELRDTFGQSFFTRKS